MQRTTSFVLLTVGALITSTAGRAQAPQAQAPQATVRELATIEGMMNGYPVLLPSGRALIYTPLADGASMNFPRPADSTFAYDIATKRSTLLGKNMLTGSVSPQGDRLAFDRTAEDGTGDFLWTMPIDPQTGVATGPAQRVSLRNKNGVSAKFSPDGKMLAFFAGPRPDGTWDLTLVPATGGPERVVANYARSVSQAWSADGKSLHVALNGNDPRTAIERVLLDGGRREPLVPLTRGTLHNAVGLSPDARVAFFHENPDRFFYRTASGVEGEVSAALPRLDDGSGRNMTLQSMKYTTMTHVIDQGMRVLDLATGQARDLLPGNVKSSTPAWSPDGRRLAVLSGNLSHYDITVVNADGSSPRRYPMPMHLEGWVGTGVWDTPWSPDGRFLAFRATRALDLEKVGYSPSDQGQLALLDVNSGQTRVLTTISEPIGRFVWRSDGNAIRALERTLVPMTSPPRYRYSVVEIPLNGPARPVRDISAEFPNVIPNTFVFTSDRAVVVRVATDKSPALFLVPLDGGAARRLPDPGTEPGLRLGGPGLVARNQLLIAQVDDSGGAPVIKILSTVAESTRTLRLSFSTRRTAVLPDGKQIVSIGKATGDSAWKLFLVPLDGSATRVIGEIPYDPQSFVAGGGGLLAPSPDGTLLAYSSHGHLTSTILEIDFSPALQAIMKR